MCCEVALKFIFNVNNVAISMTVRYMWRKSPSSPWYYRRKVPADVRAILERRGELSPAFNTKSLRTHDDNLAMQLIAREVKKDDEYFYQLREGLATSNALKLAEEKLNAHGLVLAKAQDQKNHIELDLFYDHLRSLVPEDGRPQDHLDDASLVSLQVLRGEYRLRLSDAESHYSSTRELDRSGVNTVSRSFKRVYGLFGDRPIEDIRRKDVSSLVASLLSSGLRTATVKRELGVVRTAVTELLQEHERTLITNNPFAELRIPKLHHDAEKRRAYTQEELEVVRRYVSTKNGTTPNIIGLLLDTGTRLSEVVGLRCEDVVLDGLVPYIHVTANEKRRLKTRHSTRKVPLVGLSLVAAKQALDDCTGEYLFPRYMKGAKISNNSASAAIGKALKSINCPSPHCLRHTMRTRLSNADVPRPVVDEIHGWNDSSMAAHYGEQTALENMARALNKAL